jgi:hypothetical protein
MDEQSGDMGDQSVKWVAMGLNKKITESKAKRLFKISSIHKNGSYAKAKRILGYL